MAWAIGILGAAGIAPNAIIRPALRHPEIARIAAVAARRPGAAAEYAALHGIPRAHDGYDALLADPEIELVYNALPPSEHAEWSIAALEAGKHVLCEKPFALSLAQARRMRDAAESSGRRLVEAFHDRYHPLSARIAELAGELGGVTRVEAEFIASNPFDAASLRHDPALGGGALMDLGCYPVHWVRALLGAEPTVTSASAVRNPLGADESIEAELAFPGAPGVVAIVRASMTEGNPLRSRMRVEGRRGWIEADNLVFPSSGHSIRAELDGVPHAWTVGGETTYDHQLLAVAAALTSGAPLPTEGEDPLGNMAAIDAIYAAAGFARDAV